MISLRRCNKLFATSIICMSTYSKISSLATHNQFVRKHIVVSYGCAAKISPYKCGTTSKRNFSNSSDKDDVQNFQYMVMMLHKSINDQNVTMKNLEQIIQSLENNNYDLSPNLGVMLLKCCGNLLYYTPLKTRQELTNRIWNLLKIQKCEVSIDHYHALLCTYIDNACTVDPYEFLKSMTVKPEYNTYCLLLNVLSSVGDIKSAETLVSDMSKKGWSLGEEGYNALVYAYSVNGDMTKAKEVISSMVEANIQPSPTTNIQLMFAFAKNSNFENLMEVLRTTVIPVSDMMKLVKFLSLSNNGMHIPNVLTFMQPLDKAEMDVLSVIVQLVHAQHYLDAYAVINYIPIDAEHQRMRKTLAFCLLKEMIKLNVDSKLLLKIVADFAVEHNIIDVWKKAVQFALYENNEMLVLTLFKEMKAKGMVVQSEHYWPLFSIVCQNNKENDIYSIIRHMTALAVEIDSKTLIHYVFPYINTSDPVLTVKKMLNNGVAPAYTVESLMMFLLNKQRVEESLNLCKIYKKKVDCQNMLDSLISNYKTSKNIDHCIQLLFELSYNGRGFAGTFLKNIIEQPDFELKDFIKFLNAMQEHEAFMSANDIKYIGNKVFGMNLDQEVEHYISHLFVALTADESIHNCNSGQFVHPDYMNEDQLQSHLYMLKSTGKNARGALRKLFIMSCKKNTVDQVNELLEELKSKNMKWSPGMKIALFDFYTKNRMITDALVTLQEIQSEFPNFQIDNFKILQFVISLLKENMVEEAFNIIKECTCINQKPDVFPLCSKVLSLLASSDYFNDTKKMVQLLIEKGYCTNNSSILRWLVVVPMSRDDIESAVNVFRQCVKRYNKTPAKQELLTELIQQTSESSLQHNQSLQEVYGLIEKVHGNTVAVTNLAISLALCNKINKLQNLLKKADIPGNRLLSQVRYLKEHEIIKTSLTLLEVGGNILKTNLEPICLLTLTIYNKQSDCESAVELEEKMRKNGITPSKAFQMVFTTLLTSHKYPISNSNATSYETILNKNKIKNKHDFIQ